MYVFLTVIGDEGFQTTGDLTLLVTWHWTGHCSAFEAAAPLARDHWAALSWVSTGWPYPATSKHVLTCSFTLSYFIMLYMLPVCRYLDLCLPEGRFLIARCIASWLSAYTARGAGIPSPTWLNKQVRQLQIIWQLQPQTVGFFSKNGQVMWFRLRNLQ
jgi:hypothetical protein